MRRMFLVLFLMPFILLGLENCAPKHVSSDQVHMQGFVKFQAADFLGMWNFKFEGPNQPVLNTLVQANPDGNFSLVNTRLGQNGQNGTDTYKYLNVADSHTGAIYEVTSRSGDGGAGVVYFMKLVIHENVIFSSSEQSLTPEDADGLDTIIVFARREL